MALPPSSLKVVGVRNRLEALWKLYEEYITDIKYIKHVFRTKNSELMERCIDEVQMRHWQKFFDAMDFWTSVWDKLLDMLETVHIRLSCFLSTHPRVWEVLWRAHNMYFVDFWTEKMSANIDIARPKRLAEIIHDAAQLCRHLPHFSITPAWDGGMFFMNEQRHLYIHWSFKKESFDDMLEKMDLFDQNAGQKELLYREKFDMDSVNGIGVPGFPYRALRYAKDSTRRSSKGSSEGLEDPQNGPEADDLGPGPKSQSRFLKCFQELASHGQLPIREKSGDLRGLKK